MLGVVECLHSAYSKFPPESGSVRIFKIGKNLTKLQPKFDSLLFLEHGVVVYRYSAEAGG